MDPIVKCQNADYECSINAEENQRYCIRHILQDTTAPYKQCTYMLANKQCMQAKLVEDRADPNASTYCFEHSLLSQLNKTKTTIGSFKQIDSTETLVHSLVHHVKTDKVKPQSTTKLSPLDDDEDVDIMTPTVNPFTDLNPSEINNRGKNILDFASDSSSDEEPTTLTNTWRSNELDHSDDESVDSSEEDMLKHAGIYTVDEVVSISKEKMQRLQALYIDQFQRLKYVLREKRRQYLIDLKKERETCSSIYDQIKDTPKERKLYKNLKAMNHYHKRHGPEALLHRQFLEKRQRQAETAAMAAPVLQSSKSQTKCLFSEGGVKCNERVIPCCRFCRKHVMEDKKQILFKACGVEKSGIVCQESVFNIFDDSSCVLHTTLPSPKTYVKRKYESETEEEEGDHTLTIKKEEVEMDTTTNEFSDSTLTEAEIKMEITIEPTSTDEIQVA